MAHSRVFQFESVSKAEFDDYGIEVLTEDMLDKC